MVAEIFFGFWDLLFGPLLSLGPLWTITAISIILSFILSLLYKLIIDQDEMKRIKTDMKEIQKRIKKAQKEGKEKELKDLWQKSLKINNKQMTLTMKPLIVSMLIILLILPWLHHTFPEASFVLPFALPMFGALVGWLGLYIIVSLPSTFILRKLLGVD